MNTPTPAQALGEALALIAKYDAGTDQFVLDNGGYVCDVALDLLRQHGQHFEGLEAANLRLQRVVDELSHPWTDEDGAAWIPPTAWAYAQACKARSNWQDRAEAAEARVREAEGLLRECITPRNPLTRSTDELVDDIRALLAARG